MMMMQLLLLQLMMIVMVMRYDNDDDVEHDDDDEDDYGGNGDDDNDYDDDDVFTTNCSQFYGPAAVPLYDKHTGKKQNVALVSASVLHENNVICANVDNHPPGKRTPY